MDKPNFQGVLYLFLIAVVGLGASVFSWTYLGTIQKQPQPVQIAYRQPLVLGAYMEKQLPTEEPLAGQYKSDNLNENSVIEAMSPSEVNGLFQENCQRSAAIKELDQWYNKNSAELLSVISSLCN